MFFRSDDGTTTSDAYGNYALAVIPDVEGTYMIIATFTGSNSYYGSIQTTYMAVGPAPEPAQPTETEAPGYTTIDLAILAAVIVALIIGTVIIYILRKRK